MNLGFAKTQFELVHDKKNKTKKIKTGEKVKLVKQVGYLARVVFLFTVEREIQQ